MSEQTDTPPRPKLGYRLVHETQAGTKHEMLVTYLRMGPEAVQSIYRGLMGFGTLLEVWNGHSPGREDSVRRMWKGKYEIK